MKAAELPPLSKECVVSLGANSCLFTALAKANPLSKSPPKGTFTQQQNDSKSGELPSLKRNYFSGTRVNGDL